MQNIERSIITEAKKQCKDNFRKFTKQLKSHDFPIGKSFTCPFCFYNPASAKVFENEKGLLFCCFACNEKRRIK